MYIAVAISEALCFMMNSPFFALVSNSTILKNNFAFVNALLIYACMYIPFFLCMFFGVCLLCVGVKTYTKRDVPLKEKNIKREKGELEHKFVFLRTQRKIRKQYEKKNSLSEDAEYDTVEL